MTADSETISKIPDQKPVRAFIPMLNKTEKYRANCVFQQTSPPEFNLLFRPGTLPEEHVDLSGTCIVSIDMGGPVITLQANIKEMSTPQLLKLVLQKTVNHEQMRDYFRVDATTRVVSSSFQPEYLDPSDEAWSLTGKTVDISGSGLLAVFQQMPPMDKQVVLDITLPTSQPETVQVLAHPVRVHQLGETHFEVAYHFDEIEIEDRDKIIGCCLDIQRKLLRLKVRVKDLDK